MGEVEAQAASAAAAASTAVAEATVAANNLRAVEAAQQEARALGRHMARLREGLEEVGRQIEAHEQCRRAPAR